MRWNPKLVTALLAGALTAAPAFAMPFGQTAKQDMKAAGQDTKDAAHNTGHAVKTGTKHAARKTKNGTKDAYADTKYHTKRTAHRTKNAARDARDGAENPQ